MADVLDIVTLDASDNAVQLLNLNDFGAFTLVADSLQLTPPAKQQGMQLTDRRYGGARQVAEAHENGQVACTLLVRGNTAQEAAARVSAVLATLERIPRNIWLRWIPDGTTAERRFEIRSTAQWQVDYRWGQWRGAGSVAVQVAWQVAPLVHGRRVSMSLGSVTTPAVVQLSSPVPGDAPALADVTITTGTGTGDPPIWALLAWARRPAAGLAPAPLGLMHAADADNVSGWAFDGAHQDLRTSAASSTTRYTASWLVDPAAMIPDAFEEQLGVEVWARVLLAPSLRAPTLTVSARPEDGPAWGSARWTEEWGSAGRIVTVPATNAAWRWTRLGTLRLHVDPLRPRPVRLWLDAAVGPGSSSWLGVRALMLVPVQARACSPSGVPGDATFPRFIASNAATRKIVRSDLSAVVGRPGVHGHPDHGLGGQLIELPPGDVDVAVMLSSIVPDDPRALSAEESLFGRSATVDLSIVPRWHLMGAA